MDKQEKLQSLVEQMQVGKFVRFGLFLWPFCPERGRKELAAALVQVYLPFLSFWQTARLKEEDAHAFIACSAAVKDYYGREGFSSLYDANAYIRLMRTTKPVRRSVNPFLTEGPNGIFFRYLRRRLKEELGRLPSQRSRSFIPPDEDFTPSQAVEIFRREGKLRKGLSHAEVAGLEKWIEGMEKGHRPGREMCEFLKAEGCYWRVMKALRRAGRKNSLLGGVLERTRQALAKPKPRPRGLCKLWRFLNCEVSLEQLGVSKEVDSAGFLEWRRREEIYAQLPSEAWERSLKWFAEVANEYSRYWPPGRIVSDGFLLRNSKQPIVSKAVVVEGA